MYNMLNLEKIINKLPDKHRWIGSVVLAVLVGFITLITEFVSKIPKIYYVVALAILFCVLIFYIL